MGTINGYYEQRRMRVGCGRRVRAALDQVTDVIAESRPPSAKSDVSVAQLRVPLITTEVSVNRGTLRPVSFRISNFKAIEELNITLPLESLVKSERTDSTLTPALAILGERSEERRVGKECVSTCRSRWT